MSEVLDVMTEAEVEYTPRKPMYLRKFARNKWRRLTCKQRNQIKHACGYTGFEVYKQMM